MSRIPTPSSINDAPTASQPILEAVNKQLGSVPNIFRMISNSPAALEGYVGLNGALAKGKLDPQTRERIALAIAAENGCSYCLSAHAYLGKNLAKLEDAEIAANQGGTSTDPKAVAAVRFAVSVLKERGHISNEELNEVRSAGYSNEEIIEIVQHVALNIWTNFINEVAQTEIDFPVVKAEKVDANKAA